MLDNTQTSAAKMNCNSTSHSVMRHVQLAPSSEKKLRRKHRLHFQDLKEDESESEEVICCHNMSKRQQRIQALLPRLSPATMQRRPITSVNIQSKENQPGGDNERSSLRRTMSSNDSLGSSYYRPMTSYNKKSNNKKRFMRYSEGDEYIEKEEPSVAASAQAWDSFRCHVAKLHGAGAMSDGAKQSFALKASELHHQVIKDLRTKSLRKKAKSLMMVAKLLKSSDARLKPSASTLEEEETDSEAEEERELLEKRRLMAKRHWAIIRRNVQDKIRKRKANNMADKSWNILRHQVRAATHARTVRLELYAKYGVAQVNTKVQPLAKPTISDEIKELINNFQALEVKAIHHSESINSEQTDTNDKDKILQTTKPTVSLVN